jgi:hypothetical protein
MFLQVAQACQLVVGADCVVANAVLPLSVLCPGRLQRSRRQPGHWTPMSLARMGLRPRKLRVTGQRRIRNVTLNYEG